MSRDRTSGLPLPAPRPRTVFSKARMGVLFTATLGLGVSFQPSVAKAAEPTACLSADPSQWPAPSKPYFMVVVDTSGSMGTSITGGTNSCGYQHNRIGDARCAVKKTIEAFSGEVNFGLATYAWKLTCPTGTGTCANCDQNSGCFTNAGCTASYAPNDNAACGPYTTDPNLNGALNNTNPNTQFIHAGGYVQIPLTQDNYWNPPLNPTNFQSIFNLVDNSCGNGEIGSNSNTPLGGVLYNMNQYFAGTYKDPFTSVVVPSPIGPATFNGLPAERGCRSVNVILITDGDESCDVYNYPTYPNLEGLAVFEAGRLNNPGVTVSGQTFNIKTYVIGFVGATVAALDNIAVAGGTTSSYSTANDTQLSQALASIVGGAIKPETCDNTDNNCNGCTDEGFTHYADVQPVAGNCCTWSTAAQRTACITNYQASITAAKPKGTLELLPCTTVAQQADPTTWLCFDPGDRCDNVDNNGVGGVDEGQLKCGSPAHCPTAEICDGIDNNCDGKVDEGNVCAGQCLVSASPEVCDGCDNDCDGMTDNGITGTITCGLTPNGTTIPAYCAGTVSCKPPQAVAKGGCVTGGGYGACTYGKNPLPAETCNGIDDDCNGIVDDNIPSIDCEPPGTPAGRNYGPNSQCKKGKTQCTNGATVCVGYVGPSAEICDGIDNDCNGTVDDGATGVNQACGVNLAPCTPGKTACVNGALVCQGGIQPSPEICDGIDNDCNGVIDDGNLADAPATPGCWDLPGTACSFTDSKTGKTTTWTPPAGATCAGLGALVSPCAIGTLTCQGAAGWACKNAHDPSPEVCDGIDNNCNGVIDDGVMNTGQACGSNVGECKQGVLTCTGGKLTCVGEVSPTQETCDGKDNDCDGVIDNGIALGGACDMPYDTTLYPGTRTGGACKPGVYQCDGSGAVVCVGGVGPSPEVCDGVDNDCDGQVDEVGVAPDGINGSANPLGNPAGNIGDACGKNQGVCTPGTLGCVNGLVTCVGGTQPQPEQCDCLDNDCDGVVDNPNTNGPALCSTGKDCVKSSFGCLCAAPCNAASEFPCPGGQVCQSVTKNGTTASYCVADPCGNCAGATTKDATGKVLCAPAGTPVGADCETVPVCVCKGQNGCQSPCFGVTCSAGSVCAETGSNAGTCVADNCFNNPCQGCGKVCNHGSCQTDPCSPDPCGADEECKPSDDFSTHTCEKSCATVSCQAGETCVLGQCAPTCVPACDAGKVCDTSSGTPTCVADKCQPNPCTDGSFCNPATGACGNDPCSGVACPTGQSCQAGSCFMTSTTTSSSASGSASASGSGGAGATGSGATSTGTGHGNGGGGGEVPGRWGLATGGGGCSCEAGAGSSLGGAPWAAALALALGLARRAKRRGREEEVGS